ncbi:MAG: DUF1080 domain-containing protein [Verrucomicrobia bacterium]|nr:DUF1080 domain-containing protein [Verrucomicrobiota bacterium]
MKRILSVIVSLLCAFTLSSLADVKLPAVIGSHMVLQRAQPCPIWGWADPGEQVTVEFGSQKISVQAGADGTWRVNLRAMKANSKPQIMTVTGKNKIVVEDVLVGEVWLCSGQSNMEWTVGSSDNAKEELAAANHPRIRHIKIPHRPSDKPESDVSSDGWKLCSPETVKDFTAVGYFYGRTLMTELDVPIGLLGCNWGGTRIEPWTPPVGFQAVPALKQDFADKLSSFPEVTDKKDKEGKVELGADGKPIKQINHQTPLALYNGMVHPLVPFAIRGALWYQGESNNGEGMLYFEKMKALIAGWRSVWNNPRMPFCFVQLAPFTYGGDDSKLAGIWEAQTATLSVPNTGMAVTTDISNLKDIHPKNKQDVGRRLALWALAKTYGKRGIVYSGPLYKGMKAVGNKIELSFDHVGGGLVSRDGRPLSNFTIAGSDQNFVDARAEIIGKKIVVSSDAVANPVAVRFAMHQLAEPNFSNKDGLPASPFRTDTWPLVGFKAIFNGKNLDGWEGNPKLWSVVDGVITGKTSDEGDTKIKHNTFLVWKAGEVADFELRLQYKIVGGNSGIQYRSKVLEQGEFGPIVGGYQADFEAGKTYSGILYEERGRGILAKRGEKTVLKSDAAGKLKIEVTGSVGNSDTIQSKINNEDWNDYVVIAKGNHLQHFINGNLTVDVTDEDSAKAAKSGVLALQIHAGPAMTVQFRNIRLK